MNTEMETLVRHSLDRLNARDLEGYVQTLYVEDAALHYLPPGLPDGAPGARIFYRMVLDAFENLQVTPLQSVASGNRLGVHFRMTGSHQGDFMGVPASGKSFAVEGITILRFENGKCIERWSETDMLGLVTQISR